MSAVMDVLDEGSSLPSLPLATSEEVKAPDVIWMSPGRWEQLQETGKPSTLTLEICVEVMTEFNNLMEIEASELVLDFPRPRRV